MQYDPIDDQIMSIAADRKRALLDAQFDGVVRGALVAERVEQYRSLSGTATWSIINFMRRSFPRRGDAVPDGWSPGFRRVVEAMQGHARDRFGRAPHGDARRNDRVMDVGRPGVVISGDRPPDPGDPSPRLFDPANGEHREPYWPEPPSPRFKPHYLELPGCLFPDNGESDVWPVQTALSALSLVRWARGRPVIWLQPGQTEPE